MAYGETLLAPIKVGNISNSDVYYKALSGSQLECLVLDSSATPATNLVARGTGFSFNENYQQTPVLEWAQRKSLEIVTGLMPPGQIQIATLFFMNLNDNMPTVRELVNLTELSVMVRIALHEDPKLQGLVLDVFQGVKIGGQSGNWNAQSLYLRNAQLIYRERLTGLQWLQANPGLANAQAGQNAAYPAAIK